MVNFFEKIKKLTIKSTERKTKRQLKKQIRIIKKQATTVMHFIKRSAKKGYSFCHINFVTDMKKDIGLHYISLKHYGEQVEYAVIELIEKLGFKVKGVDCHYYSKYTITWDTSEKI